MSIERINPESIAWPSGGLISRENRELEGLAPGEAFKTPCRWKHYKVGNPAGSMMCGGTNMIGSFSRRHGMRAQTTCRDGTLFVMRVE
jgi:hypothetical protein